MYNIEKIKNEDDIKEDFTCGISYIDRNIKECYYAHLCRQEMVYLCKLDNSTVGYIVFSISELSNAELVDKVEYSFGSNSFGVIYMNYIAIDFNNQHKGYGSRFLAKFISEMKDKSKELPLRCIVINSLKDKVDWYCKRGFRLIESKDDNPKMFVDLLDKDDIKIIDNYGGIV